MRNRVIIDTVLCGYTQSSEIANVFANPLGAFMVALRAPTEDTGWICSFCQINIPMGRNWHIDFKIIDIGVSKIRIKQNLKKEFL